MILTLIQAFFNKNIIFVETVLYGTVFFRSKEVFYDFQDYRKLEKSLQTIDQNETALDTEYTRLYNLAEQNRKDIITSWNARFAPNQQIGANGTYVTGSGTDSIKGAIDSMPVHTFNEIGLSFANGVVNVSYPNPAWGYYKGGAIDTATINAQIAEAMKHTERYNYQHGENPVHDFGENHKVRIVDATAIYEDGWKSGDDNGYKRGLAEGGNFVYAGGASQSGFGSKNKSIHLAKGQTYHLRVVAWGQSSKVSVGDLVTVSANGSTTGWEVKTGGKIKKSDVKHSYGGITAGAQAGGGVGSIHVEFSVKEDKDVTMTVNDAYNGGVMAVIE